MCFVSIPLPVGGLEQVSYGFLIIPTDELIFFRGAAKKHQINLNHPFLDGIFHYKPTIFGYPPCMKPPLAVWMLVNPSWIAGPNGRGRRAEDPSGLFGQAMWALNELT